MSAAHDAHADASTGHHDAHDHFDNEPATELGADEPRTPNWVPYLGLALFFSAGVACLVCGEDKPADAKAVAVEAAPAPQAAPQPPPQVVPMRPQQPGMPVPMQLGQPGQPGQPGAAGMPPNGLRQLSPEQAKELQRLIEQRQGQQPPGGAIQERPVIQPGAAAQPAPVRQPVPPGQPAHL